MAKPAATSASSTTVQSRGGALGVEAAFIDRAPRGR
jgi:hypothetical protein